MRRPDTFTFRRNGERNKTAGPGTAVTKPITAFRNRVASFTRTLGDYWRILASEVAWAVFHSESSLSIEAAYCNDYSETHICSDPAVSFRR